MGRSGMGRTGGRISDERANGAGITRPDRHRGTTQHRVQYPARRRAREARWHGGVPYKDAHIHVMWKLTSWCFKLELVEYSCILPYAKPVKSLFLSLPTLTTHTRACANFAAPAAVAASLRVNETVHFKMPPLLRTASFIAIAYS